MDRKIILTFAANLEKAFGPKTALENKILIMPRKAYYTKEQVADAALNLIRREGPEALTARNLAWELGVTTSAIFTHFDKMEDVYDMAFDMGWNMYINNLVRPDDTRTTYKDYCMRTIEFSQNEPNLFKMVLFNRLSQSNTESDVRHLIIHQQKDKYGITEAQASALYEMLHIFSVGISTFMAAGDKSFSKKRINTMLEDMFSGMLNIIKEKEA